MLLAAITQILRRLAVLPMFELFCSVFLRPNPEWRVDELHSCDVAVASDVFSKEGLIRSQLPLHIAASLHASRQDVILTLSNSVFFVQYSRTSHNAWAVTRPIRNAL